MELTTGQESCIESLFTFLRSPNEQLFLVEGSAGTGKTFLICQALERYCREERKKLNFLSIAITAPTNNAVGVLMEAARDTKALYRSAEFLTIYSLLGLKLVKGETQREIAFGSETNINYDIIVVDEASMVDSKIFSELNDKIPLKTKVIFLGDRFQLNPIGEDISRALQVNERFELTEVVRQKADSPVFPAIVLAKALVEKEHQGKKVFFDDEFNEDGSEGVWVQDKGDWYTKAISFFRSHEYQENPNSAKIITWRNAVCDRLNERVRCELIDAPEPFTPGETLVAREAIVKEGSVLVPTAAMVTVEECQVMTLKGVVPPVLQSLKVPEIALYLLKIHYDGKFHTTATVSTKEQGQLASFLKQVIDKGRYYKKSGERGKAKLYFDAFWHIKESVADLTYGYGLTVRRSQGKTFTNTFVHLDDLLQIRSYKERWRSVYVALSRTSKRLFILN